MTRPPVQAASTPRTLWGDALRGLRAATTLLRVFIARARTSLALGACGLLRGRAARLRGPAGLLRGSRRVARGLRGRVATLVGLLIHHGPVCLRGAGVVGHRRALRLRRTVCLLRLRWTVRLLRLRRTVCLLRLRRPIAAVRRDRR